MLGVTRKGFRDTGKGKRALWGRYWNEKVGMKIIINYIGNHGTSIRMVFKEWIF